MSQPNQPNQPSPKQNPKPNKGFRRFIPRRPIKAAVREETAGGVVFRRNSAGKVEILMIQDAKNRWTIPKGHVEEGERLEETAIREIQEETGLKELRILDHLGKTNFRYRREDKLILMTQHMFLIQAVGDTSDIQKEEWMKGIKWFVSNDALDAIEYEDIHKLFLIALKKIRDGGY